MKTLIISVDFPLPEDKGNRMRTMHFARYFLRQGDVDLMCYRSHLPERGIASPFRKLYAIDMSGDPGRGSLAAVLRDKFLEPKPWIVQNFTPETVKFVQQTIMSEDYDVVLCRYSYNAYPLLGLPDKYRQRVVLDVDDLMNGDLYDVMNASLKGLSRIKVALDKRALHKYQLRCLELGRVLFCSEEDRAKLPGDNLFVVPNIAPRNEVPDGFRTFGHPNRCLLFVGTLSYQPNEDGISRFIREIFQQLPDPFRDYRLLVVGKAPRPQLKELCAATPGVELVENPPDVSPYYERCGALVVPIFAGGGTRIKILEAGNFSRPVLSTPLGAYGLGLEERKEVLYFDDRASFLEQLGWLQEEGNYRSLVANLHQVVSSRFGEAAFTSCMERLGQWNAWDFEEAG